MKPAEQPSSPGRRGLILPVSVFLVVFGVTKILELADWPRLHDDAARSLGLGGGTVTVLLIVAKCAELALTATAVLALTRRRLIWALAALTGWTAEFAVLAVAAVILGAAGRALVYTAYLAGFAGLFAVTFLLAGGSFAALPGLVRRRARAVNPTGLPDLGPSGAATPPRAHPASSVRLVPSPRQEADPAGADDAAASAPGGDRVPASDDARVCADLTRQDLSAGRDDATRRDLPIQWSDVTRQDLPVRREEANPDVTRQDLPSAAALTAVGTVPMTPSGDDTTLRNADETGPADEDSGDTVRTDDDVDATVADGPLTDDESGEDTDPPAAADTDGGPRDDAEPDVDDEPHDAGTEVDDGDDAEPDVDGGPGDDADAAGTGGSVSEAETTADVDDRGADSRDEPGTSNADPGADAEDTLEYPVAHSEESAEAPAGSRADARTDVAAGWDAGR